MNADSLPEQRLCADCALLRSLKAKGRRAFFWCKKKHRTVPEEKLFKPCRSFKPKSWE